jgi:hypothetical protein
VWAAAGWAGDGYDGFHIFAPDGQRIGMILLPEICANLCFWRTDAKPSVQGRQPIPLRFVCRNARGTVMRPKPAGRWDLRLRFAWAENSALQRLRVANS